MFDNDQLLDSGLSLLLEDEYFEPLLDFWLPPDELQSSAEVPLPVKSHYSWNQEKHVHSEQKLASTAFPKVDFEPYPVPVPSSAPLSFTISPHTTTTPQQTVSTRRLPTRAGSRWSRTKNGKKNYIDGEPEVTDVLCGQGHKTNEHEGNKRYLELVMAHQAYYKGLTSRTDKTPISKGILHQVHTVLCGRFVAFDNDAGLWYVIEDSRAQRKISQSLRDDHSPKARKAKRIKYAKNKTSRNY